MSEYKGRVLPEPREGITGTGRTVDDLLSLDDLALPRRFMMVGLAECLSWAVWNPDDPRGPRIRGRNHICELDGVEIDGHSDPCWSGACVYCSKDHEEW